LLYLDKLYDILPLFMMILWKTTVLVMHDNGIDDEILYQYSSIAFTLINTMNDFYTIQSLKLWNRGEIPLDYNFFYQVSINILNSKYSELSIREFNDISEYPSSEWELKERYWLFAAVIFGTLWFWDAQIL
jgi:hypothetical protein